MNTKPNVNLLPDGSKIWSSSFDSFSAKVYVPFCEINQDIINYGFQAPYLLIFEEKPMSEEEAVQFAESTGLANIAKEFAGHVTFIYPNNKSWREVDSSLYADIMAHSRIGQYHENGYTCLRDRFTGEWGAFRLRGGVHRTYLYGYGASADYIANNLLKTVEGEGLYGKGDITPVVCILSNLSSFPASTRADIPVVSIGNSKEINDAILASQVDGRIQDSADYYKDFQEFIINYRRMVGNLEKEPVLKEMGMTREPDFHIVKTAKDNRGDDKDTTSHKIGYVAYYNNTIMEEQKKVPLVMCFHGGGDCAMIIANLAGWYQVAHKYNFLLVCIENHLNSTATEMMELIEHLKTKYPIDEGKIYSTGFSMGGCKSWDMFQEYPKVFAAVAPMDATFDVGLNSYGQPVDNFNQDVLLPVFYVGGEITPLPELPFQELKCLNRMKYVLKINKADNPYEIEYDDRENWSNKIWGMDGDHVIKLDNPERENSTLTMNFYTSNNGEMCYCVFAGVSNQGHEVRHHSCENAWKFLNSFRRLSDGTIEGGSTQDILDLYK